MQLKGTAILKELPLNTVAPEINTLLPQRVYRTNSTKPDIQLTPVTSKSAGFSSHPLNQNIHSQTIPGHNLIRHNLPHPPLRPSTVSAGILIQWWANTTLDPQPHVLWRFPLLPCPNQELGLSRRFQIPWNSLSCGSWSRLSYLQSQGILLIDTFRPLFPCLS